MGIARQTYNKELKRIHKYLPKGRPDPILHIVTAQNYASIPEAAKGGTAATINNMSGGPDDIYIQKAALKRLAKHKTWDDRNTIDHEIDHAYQKPSLWNLGSGGKAEHGAYKWSKAVSKDDPEKRKLAYKHLGKWVKKGQFNGN